MVPHSLFGCRLCPGGVKFRVSGLYDVRKVSRNGSLEDSWFLIHFLDIGCYVMSWRCMFSSLRSHLQSFKMNLELGVVGDVSGPLNISVNLFVLELDLLNFGFGLTISMRGGA